MNKHQEQHHYNVRLQDHSEKNPQTDISTPAAGETDDRESLLDELEKMMFERAR